MTGSAACTYEMTQLTSNLSTKSELAIAFSDGHYFAAWVAVPASQTLVEYVFVDNDGKLEGKPTTVPDSAFAAGASYQHIMVTTSHTGDGFVLGRYEASATTTLELRIVTSDGASDPFASVQTIDSSSLPEVRKLVRIGESYVAAATGCPMALSVSEYGDATAVSFGNCPNSTVSDAIVHDGLVAAWYGTSLIEFDPLTLGGDLTVQGVDPLRDYVYDPRGVMAWNEGDGSYLVAWSDQQSAPAALWLEKVTSGGKSQAHEKIATQNWTAAELLAVDDGWIVAASDKGSVRMLARNDDLSEKMAPIRVGEGTDVSDVHFFKEGAGFRAFWLAKDKTGLAQLFTSAISCP
jgi:hypothetical protein